MHSALDDERKRGRKAKVPTAYADYVRADVWFRVRALVCVRDLDRLYQLTGSRVSGGDADDK